MSKNSLCIYAIWYVEVDKFYWSQSVAAEPLVEAKSVLLIQL